MQYTFINHRVIVCLCYCGSTIVFFFFFNDTATTEIYTLSLHDALPIYQRRTDHRRRGVPARQGARRQCHRRRRRSEEHTSELQSHLNLVCRLLLEKKKQDPSRDEITIARILFRFESVRSAPYVVIARNP